ncbi:MAG: hypothetical protein ACJ735_00180 [Actinomycetes bacterium]
MRRGLTQLRRAAAVAAVLLSVLIASANPVFAGVTAAGSKAHTITSGTWKATPTATSFSFAGGSVPPPQYFTVNNDGALNLVGATYTLNVTGLSVGTVSVRACSLAWNETLNACVGTVTTIVTNANSPQSVSTAGLYPALVGGAIRLQIIDSGANIGTVTATLTVAVSRSQVRAATTTNS